MRCEARIFRTIGVRVPNKSQEVAWLKLSGGVRSLPQVPWWNAERRARRKARAARKRGGYGTAPIGVPLSFFLAS
jgi:hypothetical protein